MVCLFFRQTIVFFCGKTWKKMGRFEKFRKLLKKYSLKLRFFLDKMKKTVYSLKVW